MENNITEERWEKVVEILHWDLTIANNQFWKHGESNHVITKEEIEKIVSVLKNNVPY